MAWRGTRGLPAFAGSIWHSSRCQRSPVLSPATDGGACIAREAWGTLRTPHNPPPCGSPGECRWWVASVLCGRSWVYWEPCLLEKTLQNDFLHSQVESRRPAFGRAKSCSPPVFGRAKRLGRRPTLGIQGTFANRHWESKVKTVGMPRCVQPPDFEHERTSVATRPGCPRRSARPDFGHPGHPWAVQALLASNLLPWRRPTGNSG